MGGDGFFGNMQRLEASGSYGEDVVNVLHLAFDDQI